MNNEKTEKTPEEIAAEAAIAAAEAAAAVNAETPAEPALQQKISWYKRPAVKKTGWGLLALGVIGAGVWAGIKFLGGGATAEAAADDTTAAE